jgi:hypothetical protein
LLDETYQPLPGPVINPIGSRALSTSGRRSRTFWPQLIGCIVAYALVLQGMLVALSAAQVAVASASADGGLAVALCLHDPDTAPIRPDHPGDDKAHCAFCIAGAHQLLAAPDQASGRLPIAGPVGASWRPQDRLVPGSATFPDHRPRGPPSSA